jgi:hypothetical protein
MEASLKYMTMSDEISLSGNSAFGGDFMRLPSSAFSIF